MNEKKGKEQPNLPEHLVRLPGSQWALWHYMGLRSTGFPVSQVFQLSAPQCTVVADQLLLAEEEMQKAQDEALDVLQRHLEEGDTDAGATLRKAIRQVKRGKRPEASEVMDAGKEAIDAFRATCAHVDSTRANFYRTFEAEISHISQAIYKVAGTDRFREAVIWQNRRAFHTAIERLLQKAPGSISRNKKLRQREELIANYLQRYCVKNDTIGFFGPVGWARLCPQGEAVIARPGPRLLATRNVYFFEGWCIDALAETLAENKALRPWIAPRRMPFIHIEGTTLYRPVVGPCELSAEQAAVLKACNGDRLAKDLAADLIRNPSVDLKSEEDVYNLLEYMSAAGLISWTLELSVELHPERTLRRLLNRIAEDNLRRPVLETLTDLEAARSAVANAAGDAEKLDQALVGLEATFTHLTGVGSTRSAGKMYAGRTLVYEDCRRDIEVNIGPQILQSLGPPLSLLLTSSRWFTFALANIYRKAFKGVYTELAQKTGSSIVNAVDFMFGVQPLLFGSETRPVDAILPVFQKRWSDILSIPSGQRRITYTTKELKPRVLAAFDAPNPGWKSARYHSPDVLIATPCTEAIRCGRYQLVIGELHLASNTLRGSFFLAQCPFSEELFQALEFDLPEPRVVFTLPKEWPGLTSRTQTALVSPKDFHLLFAHNSLAAPESRVLSSGEFVVEDTDRGLAIRTRDRRLCFDAIEFFADTLSDLVVNRFKILRPRSHTPRITFDRLVVCRESWRFFPSEIPFAYDKSEADRFISARRWARAHGVPRFVFVKAPIEVKPVYVDFDSPTYVNIFAKIVRRTKERGSTDSLITVTEMLPGPDQVWLPDAQDQRYTSELRILAVDLVV